MSRDLDYRDALSTNLQRLRVMRGLSQTELARVAGEGELTVSTLVRLAGALGVGVGELFWLAKPAEGRPPELAKGSK